MASTVGSHSSPGSPPPPPPPPLPEDAVSDPIEEQYFLKEMSQVMAINQLDELVKQGQLESGKAAFAKEKYSELRDAFVSMLTTERTLKSEVNEMEVQLQDLTTELEKILKDSVEDEETLELVREDAEQAEAEAQMCKEKEQTILMEVSDLTRLQELYKERIQEIEKEHATALAPLITRYKLEIHGAKEATADSLAKKEQYLAEIETCKQRLQQIVDEIHQIQDEKRSNLNSLDGMDIIPDKYRKQADILGTAVKALQVQDQKWNDKVTEVEAQIVGLQAFHKHLNEELANAAIQIDKNTTLIEHKEKQAADLSKELETATLEVDDYLADQVNVDMQLRSKASDLKYEQDQLIARNREKDKALRRLKIEEQAVANIQDSFPNLFAGRDKVQHQVSLVENERKKVTAMADELRKEIDLQMHNFLVVESVGKEVYASLRASHKQVAKMEAEVAACADIERLKNQHMNNLTMMRERLCRQAVQKHNMWKDSLKKLHVMEIMVRNTMKKEAELGQQIKDAIVLYNLVRSQRNKFANLVQASGVSIAEMKDKLVTISAEVEALQSDVKYKDRVLTRQRTEYQNSVRGRTQLLDELTKTTLVLRDTQNQADEYEVEVVKLEAFVTRSEREMVKTRKMYGLEVSNRNQTGIALIDRNDELCILYEKSNVQMEVLKHSEVELHKRLDETRYLKIQSKHLQQQIIAAYKTAPDCTWILESMKDLKEQLSEAKSKTSKLSSLVENPDNLQRWKLLPGTDLSEFELHLKMTAIDEFLSSKADQALEKDFILEEMDKVMEGLRSQETNDEKGYRKHLEQVNHYQRFYHSITLQVMATVAELSLCQATVMSMNEEKEKLNQQLVEAYALLASGEDRGLFARSFEKSIKAFRLPPTKEATEEWMARERQSMMLRNWKQDQINRIEEAENKSKNNSIWKTTAERRPNAYIEDDLGLPKPFGLYSPFKPSDAGSQMRHFKNPDVKPLDL